MRKIVVLLLLAVAGAGMWYYVRNRQSPLVLTGVVTTNDVIVSPQIAGQIGELLVNEGDTVKKNQLVAVISPDELKADTAYYAHNVAGLSSQVQESEAALRYQQRQTLDQIRQAESTLAATEAQVTAAAQRTKADVRLRYTEIHAPIGGVVDVRAVRPGEVVSPGQPIVTLINPDDLWVRVDVEETYIDRLRIGDTLTVRLPSGAEVKGTVFYRGADAGFATQRDVSRTKRDIKTFEVRLRVDNADRRLAVGMTAYVLLPIS